MTISCTYKKNPKFNLFNKLNFLNSTHLIYESNLTIKLSFDLFLSSFVSLSPVQIFFGPNTYKHHFRICIKKTLQRHE